MHYHVICNAWRRGFLFEIDLNWNEMKCKYGPFREDWPSGWIACSWIYRTLLIWCVELSVCVSVSIKFLLDVEHLLGVQSRSSIDLELKRKKGIPLSSWKPFNHWYETSLFFLWCCSRLLGSSVLQSRFLCGGILRLSKRLAGLKLRSVGSRSSPMLAWLLQPWRVWSREPNMRLPRTLDRKRLLQR